MYRSKWKTIRLLSCIEIIFYLIIALLIKYGEQVIEIKLFHLHLDRLSDSWNTNKDNKPSAELKMKMHKIKQRQQAVSYEPFLHAHERVADTLLCRISFWRCCQLQHST